MANVTVVNFPENAVLVKFKVKEGSVVSNGTILCEYRLQDTSKCCKLKSNLNGTVKELLAKEGDILQRGYYALYSWFLAPAFIINFTLFIRSH